MGEGAPRKDAVAGFQGAALARADDPLVPRRQVWHQKHSLALRGRLFLEETVLVRLHAALYKDGHGHNGGVETEAVRVSTMSPKPLIYIIRIVKSMLMQVHIQRAAWPSRSRSIDREPSDTASQHDILFPNTFLQAGRMLNPSLQRDFTLRTFSV